MRFMLLHLLLGCLLIVPAVAQEAPRDKKPGDRKGKAVARPQPGQQTSRPAAAINVSGSVLLEDGNPLPAPVQVQIRCQGSVRQDTYTSADGRFSFTLGSFAPANTGVDASIGNSGSLSAPPDLITRQANDPYRQTGVGRKMPFERVDLSGCNVEAFLAGYKSEKINLGFRSPFDKPDIGAIVLHAREGVRGGTVSLNTLNAPEEALKSYEKARAELTKADGKHSKAIKELQKATNVYPAFAAAWQLMGEAYLMSGNERDAGQAFEKALQADSRYVSPYLSLAELSLRAGHWDRAAELSSKALSLNPYVIPGHYCHAISQYYLGNLDPSLASIDVIRQSDDAPLYPQILYLRGMMLAEKGDFDQALTDIRSFLATSPPEPVVEEIRSHLRQWERDGRITAGQASLEAAARSGVDSP